MLIPIDAKKHCSPAVQVGAHESQGIYGVLNEVGLPVGPMDPQSHFVVIFPVPHCIVGVDKLKS